SVVEKAQLHARRVVRVEREVGPLTIPGGAQRIGPTRPDRRSHWPEGSLCIVQATEFGLEPSGAGRCSHGQRGGTVHMRRMFFALASLALTLFAAPAALAGGWAVTTLDTLPSPLRAGETYTVGYTIRQHGQTPYVGANSAIELRSPSGELTRFKGVPAGAAGHYVAEGRFDAPGEGEWSVGQSPSEHRAVG